MNLLLYWLKILHILSSTISFWYWPVGRFGAAWRSVLLVIAADYLVAADWLFIAITVPAA